MDNPKVVEAHLTARGTIMILTPPDPDTGHRIRIEKNLSSTEHRRLQELFLKLQRSD